MVRSKKNKRISPPWPLLLIIFLSSIVIGTQLGLIGQKLYAQLFFDEKGVEPFKTINENQLQQQSTCKESVDGGPRLNENFEPCAP